MPRKGRPAGKTDIMFVDNRSQRQTCRRLRSKGLLKKAWELSKMTGDKVFLLIIDEEHNEKNLLLSHELDSIYTTCGISKDTIGNAKIWTHKDLYHADPTPESAAPPEIQLNATAPSAAEQALPVAISEELDVAPALGTEDSATAPSATEQALPVAISVAISEVPDVAPALGTEDSATAPSAAEQALPVAISVAISEELDVVPAPAEDSATAPSTAAGTPSQESDVAPAPTPTEVLDIAPAPSEELAAAVQPQVHVPPHPARVFREIDANQDDGPPRKRAKQKSNSRVKSYKVEKILRMEVDPDGKRFFVIKWKGYASKHNTREPEENIMDKNIIGSFIEEHRDSARDLSEQTEAH